ARRRAGPHARQPGARGGHDPPHPRALRVPGRRRRRRPSGTRHGYRAGAVRPRLAMSPAPKPGRRPRCVLPIFGRVPDIEPRLMRLLGLVSLALLFESYDVSMLTSALKFIAQDLGIAESELGGYLSLIRLGALPAFLLVPFTDQIGRRRVFLATIVGTSLAT